MDKKVNEVPQTQRIRTSSGVHLSGIQIGSRCNNAALTIRDASFSII